MTTRLAPWFGFNGILPFSEACERKQAADLERADQWLQRTAKVREVGSDAWSTCRPHLPQLSVAIGQRQRTAPELAGLQRRRRFSKGVRLCRAGCCSRLLDDDRDLKQIGLQVPSGVVQTRQHASHHSRAAVDELPGR